MPRAKKTEEKETKKTAPKAKKEAVKKATPKKAPKVSAEETKKPVAPKAVKKVKEVEVAKVEEVKKEVAPVEKSAKAEKAKQKKHNAQAGKDTGSVSAQIDVFSKKIKSLTDHLKHHIHDFDSKRGLLIMVGKRRRLLNYLKKNEPLKYEKLVKNLKLKK